MIKKIAAISFSPTGSTRDLVDKAAETLAGRLKLPLSYDSFTLPKDQKKVRRFTEETLVVFGMPTYAGRVPNKALPFLKTLFVGGGAPAVALVTLGTAAMIPR